MKMKTQSLRSSSRRQRGFSLIEGLVAILIFSLGVLALIGLQANSIQQSTAAKYRSDATMLANQLIGLMWVSDRTTLPANFQTGGPRYNTWLADVQSTLPAVAANPPTVAFAASQVVTITVFWKAPSEPATAPPHQYVAIAQVQ